MLNLTFIKLIVFFFFNQGLTMLLVCIQYQIQGLELCYTDKLLVNIRNTSCKLSETIKNEMSKIYFRLITFTKKFSC